MTETELLAAAYEARLQAYAPYSGFLVGAALLGADGTVYRGCNIESAAYSPSLCAERVAFARAVADGARDFVAIAVAGGQRDADSFACCFPCGVCRQVMMEFCDPASFHVIVGTRPDAYERYLLRDLLPHAFGPHDLSLERS